MTTDFDDLLAAFSESVSEVLRSKCDRRTVHGYYDGKNDLDAALWLTAVELGWLGVGVDEAAGGLGLGVAGLDVLHRQLGAAAAPGPFLSTLVGAQWLSRQAGSGETAAVVQQIVAGELTLGIPVAPGGAATPLRAGRLAGTSAPLLIPASAGMAVIEVENEAGRALALVAVGEKSARLEGIELWDRTRRVGRLACEGVAPLLVVPDADGAAGNLLRRYFALAVAGDCVGAARAIAGQTVAYLKDRQQFGRPLASLQALKHRVAKMFVAIVEAEQQLEHAIEAASLESPSAVLWAFLAKASASEAFYFVADDCLQLHGGVGFTWEFDCHIFLKRALLARELCGDNRAMRNLAAEALALAAREGRSTADIAA
ncbi:MAG: hypothetical protein EPO08_01925 [Rhodospirillaceae bacterium]|nr:MAG: hypothetical protein EPO08_01925 [Rhodospirillaceae bacterium]